MICSHTAGTGDSARPLIPGPLRGGESLTQAPTLCWRLVGPGCGEGWGMLRAAQALGTHSALGFASRVVGGPGYGANAPLGGGPSEPQMPRHLARAQSRCECDALLPACLPGRGAHPKRLDDLLDHLFRVIPSLVFHCKISSTCAIAGFPRRRDAGISHRAVDRFGRRGWKRGAFSACVRGRRLVHRTCPLNGALAGEAIPCAQGQRPRLPR